MDKVFGSTLCIYKEPEPPADPIPATEEEGAEQQPAAIGLGDYYTSVPVEQVVGKEGLEYIMVLFSAEYCPPCAKFVEPLKNFCAEYFKDGKTELVLINCDQREKEYSEHLKTMQWCHAVPFSVEPEIIQQLEDAANASVIPKLAVFNI